jgi:hypothetical protein
LNGLPAAYMASGPFAHPHAVAAVLLEVKLGVEGGNSE